MSYFPQQGEGENAQPHLLVARIDTSSYAGTSWSVRCPYEGFRPCGMLERCTGSEKDVEKWGCTPHPVEPKWPKGYKFDMEVPPDLKLAWGDYKRALSNWRDDHVAFDGEYGHHSDKCWYIDRLRSGDEDPEYYLAHITPDTEIRSPLKVAVGHDGWAEEISPLFRLWKESDDDPR
jgi:hypothetical protein